MAALLGSDSPEDFEQPQNGGRETVVSVVVAKYFERFSRSDLVRDATQQEKKSSTEHEEQSSEHRREKEIVVLNVLLRQHRRGEKGSEWTRRISRT